MRGLPTLRGIIKRDQSWRPDELWRKAFRVCNRVSRFILAISYCVEMFSATPYILVNMMFRVLVTFSHAALAQTNFFCS
jgi:hypothetical protein